MVRHRPAHRANVRAVRILQLLNTFMIYREKPVQRVPLVDEVPVESASQRPGTERRSANIRVSYDTDSGRYADQTCDCLNE